MVDFKNFLLLKPDTVKFCSAIALIIQVFVLNLYLRAKLKQKKYEFKPFRQILYSRVNNGYGCHGGHVAICN